MEDPYMGMIPLAVQDKIMADLSSQCGGEKYFQTFSYVPAHGCTPGVKASRKKDGRQTQLSGRVPA
jgi:hypothetical protein